MNNDTFLRRSLKRGPVIRINPNDHNDAVKQSFFAQDVPFEQRGAIFNKLFFHYKKDWQSSFSFMLVLSVGLASLGLSEDSSAAIIGAMIIAPLGQPIVALGGSIALGWRLQSIRMLAIIVLGAGSSIILAFGIGLTLPDITPNHEMLIRTSPDLRDLGIAILAGAAGAYGYYRSEFSTILSGVAIAVALAPPLCTCGLMLEQGHYILASGSMLLFATNFVGIAFAAILVFFVLGLKHGKRQTWFYKGTVSIIVLGAAILIPLALNYQKFNAGASFHTSIYDKAGMICKLAADSPVIHNLSIEGTGVFITLEPFPQTTDNAERLKTELEQATGLQVFLVGSFAQD